MSFTIGKAFELLQGAHAQSRLAHAYLITGPDGCGKRELASRLMTLVNRSGAESEGDGLGLDIEVESAPAASDAVPALADLRSSHVSVIEPESKSRRITIENIRVAERALHLASPAGVTKFAVIVDADRMGVGAENAFLKTLEEPPRASMLLLLTARPELLLDTILSRCIRIPMHGVAGQAGSATRVAEEGPERMLLDALAAHASESGGGERNVSAALGLMAVFAAALKEEKETVGKRNEIAFKEETQHYKNATEGDWLKRRDEYYKALTEAEYQRVRSRYVEHLVAWFGDALRQQNGSAHLDLPDYAESTGRLARSVETDALMRRAAAIDTLSSHLSTNVHEALALENGFIHAFA